MHLYRLAIAVALIGFSSVTGAFLIDPAEAQRPRPVPAGDCASMVAATGGKGIWYGWYSGRYEDEWDRVFPLYGRGCFTSEFACRLWLNEMLTLANGWSAARSCRPYNKRR